MIDPTSPDYTRRPGVWGLERYGYAPSGVTASPLVTILTPFYNTGELFHETARAVFGQSLQQWEWLIVNDCSTDPAALAILDEYRERDPRIRVLDNPENLGLPGTRNVGFAAARAEYVFLWDDDDLMEPTALEKMWFFLQSQPQFAVVNAWSVGFGAKDYLWPTGFDRAAECLQTNYVTGRALVRKSVHEAVGECDASIRGGMEDWEYWLRLASHGYWGYTLPEYLEWYRRRENHTARWSNIDQEEKRLAFGRFLRERYAKLYEGEFPQVPLRVHEPGEALREGFPDLNRLARSERRRMVMIVPWLTLGGADKFNLDLVGQLAGQGWELTLATTLAGDHGWLPRFAEYTPDIFPLHHFLHPTDHPAFLRYLVESRQPDVVLASNSELGYEVLDYLRAHCPDRAYVDYCHSEQMHWQDGGYPRYAVKHQQALDLNIVSSQHLKAWMTERGADGARIDVVTVNVDASFWRPDGEAGQALREELGIGPAEHVIVFAGRLHEDKQPHVLGGTLHALQQRGVAFHCLVAGDGPERGWLEQYLADHGLAAVVHLLGARLPEQMRGVYNAGDVFFLPSRSEGIALTIYESLACGVPVIGADVGGQRELVTPECGLLLPRSDAAQECRAYADALAGLLADPARRAAWGAAGRRRIEEDFDLRQMGARMVAAFDRALELHAQSPRPTPDADRALEQARQAVEYQRLWRRAHERVAPPMVAGPSVDWQQEMAELRTWIDELESGKRWLEDQRQNYEATVADLLGQLDEMRRFQLAYDHVRQQLPYRLLRKVGLLREHEITDGRADGHAPREASSQHD
jgi:glycosyltransferase involved in cell wall biosynthesis